MSLAEHVHDTVPRASASATKAASIPANVQKLLPTLSPQAQKLVRGADKATLQWLSQNPGVLTAKPKPLSAAQKATLAREPRLEPARGPVPPMTRQQLDHATLAADSKYFDSVMKKAGYKPQPSGGILNTITAPLKRPLTQIGQSLYDTPKGVKVLAKGVGGDLKAAAHGDPSFKNSRAIGTAMAKGVAQDVRHPRGRSGYLLMDGLAVASLGVGAAAKFGAVSRVGEASRAATAVSAATRMKIAFLKVVPTAKRAAARPGEGWLQLTDWTRYPPGGPKPAGPFRILEGQEYAHARKAANTANGAMHRADPSLRGKQIHEVHPVKFGGHPTDPANKIALSPTEHQAYTRFWNEKLRQAKSAPAPEPARARPTSGLKASAPATSVAAAKAVAPTKILPPKAAPPPVPRVAAPTPKPPAHTSRPAPVLTPPPAHRPSPKPAPVAVKPPPPPPPKPQAAATAARKSAQAAQATRAEAKTLQTVAAGRKK
jgi:hypothetical protein